MSQFSEIEHVPLPSKPVLSMFRIYVANLLMAEYGIDTFSKEAIDCLVMHLYKFIALLMLKIKKVVAGQGRTIPNFLHLLYACETMGCQLDNFLLYLQEKQKVSLPEKPDKVINKFDIKKLVTKQNGLYQNQIFQQNSKNILTIPLNYLTTAQLVQQPLPVRMNVYLTIPKPPFYTYEQHKPICFTKKLDDQKALKERIYSQKQIKTQLGKLRKQKILNSGASIFKNDAKLKNYKNQVQHNGNKNISFDLFKYL